MKDNYLNYYRYLKTTSILGKIYRKFFLYPLLSRFVKGNFIDVGCGLGDFLFFGSKGSLGLDINKFNVDHCRSRGLHAELIKDGKFPVDDDSFSTINLDQVLEHIIEPDILLKEINRCLNIGGRLIIGVPCESGYKRDPDHKMFYNLEKIKKVLSKYNFSILVTFYTPLPLKFFGKILPQQSLYVISKLEKKM
ncbi:Methyltransferase type 11 [Prochlorococcus marinus str. MIT 9302]|uniref:Methyltransferase type 11 n=1 Tax=Prochlorococcus marinus str. MIT 9302 TaxID=74545 RepID=A0A0A2A7U1_PROMR|nr:class I SAM-dependent methyltransferase [Prochlorococcus marinus]KGF96916.1 Methyltransferase type 11 [Prochlorococcus marinus str. MIT 9302]